MPRRSRGDDGRGDLAESPEPKGSDAPKVARQIETLRPPDPIMRRPMRRPRTEASDSREWLEARGNSLTPTTPITEDT
jgi:hypothetical protein